MKVAIIGNGAGSLSKSNGSFIDRCDKVIRMNNFVLNGFESNVGTKLDIYMSKWFLIPQQGLNKLQSYNEFWFCFPEPKTYSQLLTATFFEEQYLRLWLNSLPQDEADAAKLEENISSYKMQERPIRYFSVDDMLELIRKLQFEPNKILTDQNSAVLEPTTGLKAIHKARQYFPNAEIFITGFDSFQSSTYYWDMTLPDQYDKHAYLLEAQLLKEYISKGWIEKID